MPGKGLAIELYAGTGSGTAGWCELGGTAVCFDLEYLPHHGQPAERSHRVIQDVLTVHGSQFKDADFLWGSSPCQAYSYLAMPWSRSKCPLCKGKQRYFAWQLTPDRPPASADVRTWGDPIACDCKENSAKAKELRRRWELDGPDNTLFDSVSRIQREASAAAGREIPFLQENVRGAVPWVGKRDMSLERWKSLTQAEKIKAGRPDAVFGSFFLWGSCAQIGNRVVAGRDLEDIRAGRGRFGMGVAPEKAQKGDVRKDETGEYVTPDGTKIGGDWFSDPNSTCRKHGSRSSARKAASALIAKIPYALSRYVAEQFLPQPPGNTGEL